MHAPFRLGFFVLALTAGLLTTALSGCASTSARTRTCAMILLIDGKHLHPSQQQYEAVERKITAQFASRRLQLVPEINSAELLATIECRVHPDRPELTDLVVRDVSLNTFVSRNRVMPPISEFPSLRAAELEQERARQGH